MTIRELLKDIYDTMMRSKEIESAKYDNADTSHDMEFNARYGAAEEMLRQVFKRLHEAGMLDIDTTLIRKLRKDNEDIHSNRKPD